MSHLSLIASLVLLSPGQGAALDGKAYAADFVSLWTEFRDYYAYRATAGLDWNAVRTAYEPRFAKVKSRSEFMTLLEKVVDEMRDSHALINSNTQESPRLVPSGADIWASWIDGKAVVAEVRPGSPAWAAEIRPGMEILKIRGKPVEQAVSERLGTVQPTPTTKHRDWALRAELAGYWKEPRVLQLRSAGKLIDVTVPQVPQDPERPPLKHEVLPGNILYVRPENSLGNNALIGAFEDAVLSDKTSTGMILDLRNTPGGGNTSVARGIMGMLISSEKPYQRHEMDEPDTMTTRVWVEYATPRTKAPYAKPLVVLVNHWTGSMGEGLAIGLESMGRATVVGTDMAGLEGALGTAELPNTKLRVSFPVERLLLPNGTPRHEYRPKHFVDLVAAPASSHDPILEEGVKVLRGMIR